MESKGFYIAFMQDDVWGIAFTIVYNRKEKGFSDFPAIIRLGISSRILILAKEPSYEHIKRKQMRGMSAPQGCI